MSAASAQGGAMWVDPLGRMMSLQLAGPAGPVATPQARSAADMSALFKRLCLDTDGDLAKLAAATAEAGLAAEPYSFSWGKKAPPVVLNLWRGNGVILSQSAGFFAAQMAQCNATFYLPQAAGRQEVADALAAAIGSPPSNADKAMDKKGRPKKYFNPEWALDSPAGPRIVTVFVERGDERVPGHRVQMSVRAARKAAR
jgi:hypothetical protein